MAIRWKYALAAVFAVALTVGARAQVAPAAIGDEEMLSVGGMVSGYRIDYGQQKLLGAGVYVDADLNWRFGIEGEARWLRWRSQQNEHADTYLVGPRYSFSALDRGHVRPYIKFLVGDGQFTFPQDFAKGSYLVLAPGAGVDYRINRRFRLRLIDFEYQYWPQFTYGVMKSYGISTGIRYRIR